MFYNSFKVFTKALLKSHHCPLEFPNLDTIWDFVKIKFCFFFFLEEGTSTSIQLMRANFTRNLVFTFLEKSKQRQNSNLTL